MIGNAVTLLNRHWYGSIDEQAVHKSNGKG